MSSLAALDSKRMVSELALLRQALLNEFVVTSTPCITMSVTSCVSYVNFSYIMNTRFDRGQQHSKSGFYAKFDASRIQTTYLYFVRNHLPFALELWCV